MNIRKTGSIILLGIFAASLFSGCGGMDIGFEQAGFCRVWANDFDKDAQATFRANLGDIDGRDIRDVPAEEIPDCDIITAGFPCQRKIIQAFIHWRRPPSPFEAAHRPHRESQLPDSVPETWISAPFSDIPGWDTDKHPDR